MDEQDQRFSLLPYDMFMEDEYMDANKLLFISALGLLSLTQEYSNWSDEALYNELKDAAALTAQQIGWNVMYRGR